MNLIAQVIKLITTTTGKLRQHMGLSDPGPRFPRFLELPAELRRQIWREAFPPSRIVELLDGPGRSGRLRAQQLVTPWITLATPPAVLYVYHESRDEALRYYQLAFGRNGFEPRIYIDFSQDIVFFGRETHGEGTFEITDSMKDLERIQHMAATRRCMARLLPSARTFDRRFTGLKNIYLIESWVYMGVPPQLEESPWGLSDKLCSMGG